MLLMKNAIRLNEFPQPVSDAETDATFNILCTRSSYHSDMGLDTLASAYKELRKSEGCLSLTIVGRIPASLRPQVACLEGNREVEFLDFLEKEELKARIGSSSVCVVPFRDVPDLAQTYPIKVLEYMAMAKPVIVSRIGGMRELVKDGENGLCFTANDPIELAQKILSIKADADFAARLGRNARCTSQAFDYTVKGRKILDTLHGLVRE